MPYTHTGPALWLNADKSKIVEEGSVESAYLLVADGGQLSDEDAAKYKLGTKAKKDVADNKAKPAAENKSGLTIERDDKPRDTKMGGK
jgi:hypothetical protein